MMVALDTNVDPAPTRRIRIADVDVIAVDFTDQLDPSELLSTVVSTQNAAPAISGGGGSISAGTVLATAMDIDGRRVEIGKGCTMTWSAPTTAGTFLVTFGVTTDASRQMNRNVKVEIVAA